MKTVSLIAVLLAEFALVASADPDLENLQKQAAKGDPAAEAQLGIAYYFGQKVPHDLGKSAFWFEKAAEQNDTKAMYNLGHMYLHGEGLPQSTALAMKWIEKSAKAGSAEGQLQMGLLYNFGDYGLKQDYVAAAKWLKLAAKQKGAPKQAGPAANALGSIFEGDLKNPDRRRLAVYWYKVGAELDYPRAQFNLGRVYEEGILTKKRPIQAYAWLKIANDHKDMMATHLFPDYQQSKIFSPEDIKKGDAIAAEFEAAH